MRITSEKPALHCYGYAVPDMTVRRLLADKAQKNGDKVFCTDLHDGRRFSYRDIDALSNRLANGLVALGFGAGSHIAVVMDNCAEQMLLHFAIMKMGGVSVPVNTGARGKLLAYFLNQSDSVAVITEEAYLERIAEALADTPAIRQLVVLRDERAPTTPPASDISVPLTDYRALEQHADTPLTTPVRFSDLAMLIYTSGTTGPSKGNMAAQATVVQLGMTTAESHGYRDDDTFYVSLPINHSAGYFVLWGALMVDASVALSRRFSVSRYWQEVRESGATFTSLMGSMSNMLWAQPPHSLDADNRLRACLTVPVPPFARAWERRFDTRVLSSYGQTDYTNLAVFTMVDPVSKLGSAGRPRSGIEMRIVDENDLDVPVGEVGELVVRSNNPWSTSQGYYKMPEATVAATRNLWWHTGDRARFDADGYLWFADRKKDSLRRRGENISAQEVESVLLEHPAVADAAVYAVSSEMSEDEVAASIVLVHGQPLAEATLIEYCVKNMAYYMVPRYLHFTDDLPRTPSQKVQKAELRRRAQENIGALWDREKAGIKVSR